MRAKKRFGQHFLVDTAVLRRLVAAVNPSEGQHFLEIGPGKGILTEALLVTGTRLDAIEIDRDLIAVLGKRLASHPTFRLHAGNALEFDYSRLAPDHAGIRIVGNLPYNIATPLLIHLSKFSQSIADMHFMLQREVAERLVALPDTRAYGRLGVMMQYRFRMQQLFTVDRMAFSPPPRVESAIVRFRPHQRHPVAIADETAFARVVRQAFNHRRKTLRNALHELLDTATINSLGIDPRRRPDTLSLAEFAHISRALASAPDT